MRPIKGRKQSCNGGFRQVNAGFSVARASLPYQKCCKLQRTRVLGQCVEWNAMRSRGALSSYVADGRRRRVRAAQASELHRRNQAKTLPPWNIHACISQLPGCCYACQHNQQQHTRACRNGMIDREELRRLLESTESGEAFMFEGG
jgi:hypothetical protein